MSKPPGAVSSEEVISSTISEVTLGLFDRFIPPLAHRVMPPSLDLVFKGDVGPYLMTRHVFLRGTSHELPARWYRLGVVNRSQATIDDVRVELISMEPEGLPGLPAVMHWMHDNPNDGVSHSETMSVPPGKEPVKCVDLVSRVQGQRYFQFEHIANGVTQHAEAKSYTLSVRVSGRDSKPRTRRFKTWVDESGNLRLAAFR